MGNLRWCGKERAGGRGGGGAYEENFVGPSMTQLAK